MDNSFNECMSLCNFDVIYSQNIRPKIKKLDIFLKCNNSPYDINEVAKLLDIKCAEIKDILNLKDINVIDTIDFFNVITHSSSYICRLIQRQWKYISYDSYTPEMVSYIYELNINKVQEAFDLLGITSVCDDQLSDVFKKIYTPIYHAVNTDISKEK